jgi:hypothetical protein
MKIFLTLILVATNLLLIGQTKEESGYYKVHKIHTADDYYLIFLRKDKVKYTIYSEKGLIVKGQKLEVGKTYFFELTQNEDTLSDGSSLIPINYNEIVYYGHYTGAELGKQCTAKNLVGLVITKP